MLYSACKDTEKKLKLQATTNKIGVVAGLIFQHDALCLRCGMAGKRKPYKGRHTVTGGCPRCQTTPLRSLLWGRTLQKSLFCGSKQALLQCKTMVFAAPRRAFRIFLTMRWLHNLEIYGICLRIFHVAAVSPLVCYFTFITLLPAIFYLPVAILAAIHSRRSSLRFRVNDSPIRLTMKQNTPKS